MEFQKVNNEKKKKLKDINTEIKGLQKNFFRVSYILS